MDEEDKIFSYLRCLGCCDGCCLRYLGVKNPNAYEKTKEYISKFLRQPVAGNGASTSNEAASLPAGAQLEPLPLTDSAITPESTEKTKVSHNGCGDSPPAKRRKWPVCVSCLGVLQEETWPPCVERITDILEKKRYECKTFACALSAPMATMLRERAIGLLLAEQFPLDAKRLPTPLKEAWKWSFGTHLAAHIRKTLDSGAVCPLLITVHMDYPDDTEELLPLKQVAPQLFRERSQQARRFAVDLTRRSVEQALEGATLVALRQQWPKSLPDTRAPACCAAVAAAHAPLCLGGRYIKLSRALPQTPWMVQGRRMMDSSVQEIIFEPVAAALQVPAADCERRLKFVAAGREDVDVRCLGSGRPFAVEITDPSRDPTESELQAICDSINKDGRVMVRQLFVVTKDDLTKLKLGEETKCKTYEALCIKLSHSKDDLAAGVAAGAAPTVSAADVRRVNAYCGSGGQVSGSGGDSGGGCENGSGGKAVWQRTPLRVLHRRALLSRERTIIGLKAHRVRGHPRLFTLRVTTTAGTYVKEWVHGELRRSQPALAAALGAQADLLRLDVTEVHLPWCDPVAAPRPDSPKEMEIALTA